MFDLPNLLQENFALLLQGLLAFLQPVSDQLMYAVQSMPDRLVDSAFRKLGEVLYSVLNAPHLMGCFLSFIGALLMWRRGE